LEVNKALWYKPTLNKDTEGPKTEKLSAASTLWSSGVAEIGAFTFIEKNTMQYVGHHK